VGDALRGMGSLFSVLFHVKHSLLLILSFNYLPSLTDSLVREFFWDLIEFWA